MRVGLACLWQNTVNNNRRRKRVGAFLKGLLLDILLFLRVWGLEECVYLSGDCLSDDVGWHELLS